VDQNENWKHHPVQRQEETLEAHKAEVVILLEAEPSHPTVDQNENWKYHPLQRQEETLEAHKAEVVILLEVDLDHHYAACKPEHVVHGLCNV